MKEHPMTGFFLTKMGIKNYVIDDKLGIVTPTLTEEQKTTLANYIACLLYTSPSPRDGLLSRMPSSA